MVVAPSGSVVDDAVSEAVARVSESLREVATETVDRAVERVSREASAIVERAVVQHGERLARAAGSAAGDRLEQLVRRDPAAMRQFALAAGEGAANRARGPLWISAGALAVIALVSATALAVSLRARRARGRR